MVVGPVVRPGTPPGLPGAPELNEARAALVKVLVVPERHVADVSPADAKAFAKKILETCNICTKPNVQFCTNFITNNIFGSCGVSQRLDALAIFLLSASKSFCPPNSNKYVDTDLSKDHNLGLPVDKISGEVTGSPQPAFKRLHIVYVLHDAMMFLFNHDDDLERRKRYDKALQHFWPSLCALVDLAACHSGGPKYVKTGDKLRKLANAWLEANLFTSTQIDYMRDRISQAEKSDFDSVVKKVSPLGGLTHTDYNAQKADFYKWLLPARHGVPGLASPPWHELPAANGLYMGRTRGHPLRKSEFPQGGYETELDDLWTKPQVDPYAPPHPLDIGESGRPGYHPSRYQENQVNDLYKDMLRCYDKYTPLDEVEDVDAMGNIIWKDKTRPVRNYWGFSIEGIDERKELAANFAKRSTGYGRY